MRRLRRFLIAALICCFGAPLADARAPNILLIYTDDQSTESFDYMPFVQATKHRARVFRHFLHALSQCCPSRASMFTGMYPHNSKVEGNKPPDGGYDRFESENLENKSWPLLLRRAGYRPAIAGKFFNGYQYPNTKIMRGFFDWFVSHRFRLKNYHMSDNGVLSHYGDGDKNYMTNVFADRIDAVIRRAHDANKPFAALFSTHCPHGPSTPAAKYQGTFAKEPFAINKKPNFNEADVSDKPAAIRLLPRLKPKQIEAIRDEWRKRLECAMSIDDAFKRFWQTLAGLGELNNTYIFLTTDNGWVQGEHRIPRSKNVPYVESFETRLFVWGPGVVAGTDLRLVGNIDLMPTILAIAGLKPGNYPWIDGRSLLQLLRGRDDVQWRNTFMVQGRPEEDDEDGVLLTAATAEEPGDTREETAIKVILARTQFRSLIGQINNRNYIYTQYFGETNDFEYYNLNADPYQLDNTYDALNRRRREAMQERLDALKNCAGQTCRALDALNAPR